MVQIYCSFLVTGSDLVPNYRSFFPPDYPIQTYYDYSSLFVHGNLIINNNVFGIVASVGDLFIKEFCCFVKFASEYPVVFYTKNSCYDEITEWLFTRYYCLIMGLSNGNDYFSTLSFEPFHNDSIIKPCKYNQKCEKLREQYATFYRNQEFIKAHKILIKWRDFLFRELHNHVTIIQ